MLYIKPHFYDQFHCIADRCPDTCCAGWQILIDEESLEKYSSIEGGFGNRMLTSIDWEEGAFLQFDRRCSFLNEEKLCDLYEEMGEEFLCRTCREYPRHTEEFENVRELSLSLSCPEAARIILECTEPLIFLSEETKEKEPEPDENFDFLMYSILNEIRDWLFATVQNRKEPVSVRMERCLIAGQVCQRALEEGNLFAVDGRLAEIQSAACSGDSLEFIERTRFLDELLRMEFLHQSWEDELSKVAEIPYKDGEASYRKIVESFLFKKWEQYGENLMMFFFYTYFCGAVYDGRIDTKVSFGIYSTAMIYDLCMARWLRQGGRLEKADVWESSWRYAREIEHSDENLEALERYFQSLCCERGRNLL